MSDGAPRVSVIIPTYNWSSVLRITPFNRCWDNRFKISSC